MLVFSIPSVRQDKREVFSKYFQYSGYSFSLDVDDVEDVGGPSPPLPIYSVPAAHDSIFDRSDGQVEASISSQITLL